MKKILGAIFGSSKNTETILSGIDKVFFTKEEKADYFLKYLAATAPQNMARRFIAGQTANEAIRTIQQLRRERMAFTVDVLGEATTSHAEADRYMQTYLDLLDALSQAAQSWPVVEAMDVGSAGVLPRVNMSIKLSSLDANFDAIDPKGTTTEVLSRLRPILRRARQVGAFVNVDVEQSQHKDLTFAIFRQVLDEDEFRNYADAGIVVQAYLTSAERDLGQNNIKALNIRKKKLILPRALTPR